MFAGSVRDYAVQNKQACKGLLLSLPMAYMTEWMRTCLTEEGKG